MDLFSRHEKSLHMTKYFFLLDFLLFFRLNSLNIITNYINLHSVFYETMVGKDTLMFYIHICLQKNVVGSAIHVR